jgi:Ca-activated chloride channel homolog
MNGNWATFHFAHPWLLAAWPLLWLVARRRGPVQRMPAIAVSSVALLRPIGRPVVARVGRPTAWVRLAQLTLCLVALARPRIDHVARPERSEGIDIMLLVDASRSMDTRDFDAGTERISRLDALRRVLAGFVAARPNDRLGIIAFAEKPYLVSPLTLDHAWLMESLGELETALGTAIGSSIEAGVDLLRASTGRSRILVLVTDGLNTSGADPLATARVAADEGVRIYTIETVSYDGMHTTDMESHPLAVIARTTGGQFFQAPDAASLGTVYRTIDELEKKQLEQQRLREFYELFQWPLGLALALLTGEIIWATSRGVRLP